MVEESNFTIIYNQPFTLSLFNIRIQNEMPFNTQNLTRCIADTVSDIGSLLKRSYNVKTLVETPKNNTILTKIQPVMGELKRGEVDLDVGKTGYKIKKYFDRICERLTLENKEIMVIPKEDGFSVLHILGKGFNPESAKLLVEATENLVLYSFNQKHKVTKSEICPYYLEHDIEIIEPPKELYS